MRIKLSEVPIGDIILITEIEAGIDHEYLMKTTLHNVEAQVIVCVGKKGDAFNCYSEMMVETEIPWYEHVDGFRLMYKNLLSETGLSFKTNIDNPDLQRVYDTIKNNAKAKNNAQ